MFLFALLLAWLAFYNLPFYPRLWFDEGIHLQVPYTLVEHGAYGVIHEGQVQLFDPAVSTGPTLLLPIALSFRLFGVGVAQARAVNALYLLLGTALVFDLTRRLTGDRTAWLAVLMVIGAPGVRFIYWGRQVMGEGPALAFFAAGLVLWFQAVAGQHAVSQVERHARRKLFLAGLFLGLAMVTKTIYAVILPPALVIAAVADHVYYRQLSWRHFLLPASVGLACLLGWYGYQFVSLGWEAFYRDVWQVNQAAGRSIFVGASSRTLPNLALLLKSMAYWGLGLPALAHAAYRARHRNLTGLGWGFLTIITLVWLTWYMVGSVGWLRYAFPALVMLGIFAAALLVDLVGWLVRWPRLHAVVLAAAAVVLVGALAYRVRTILVRHDDTPQQIAACITAQVPPAARIETWEWEIQFLAPHYRYHHPEPEWLDRMVREIHLGEPRAPERSGAGAEPYTFATDATDYLLIGPFAEGTQIYRHYLEGPRPEPSGQASVRGFVAGSGRGLAEGPAWDPVCSAGHYTLYQSRRAAWTVADPCYNALH